MNSTHLMITTGQLFPLFVSDNHYCHMKQSPKLAILQSLDGMDKVQMEDVLTYIKSILHQPDQDDRAFKKEAMKEIRQALRRGKKGLQLAA